MFLVRLNNLTKPFNAIVSFCHDVDKTNKCAPSPWAVEQNSTTFEWIVKGLPIFHTF
jgi:cytochrome c oxidase subunit 1